MSQKEMKMAFRIGLITALAIALAGAAHAQGGPPPAMGSGGFGGPMSVPRGLGGPGMGGMATGKVISVNPAAHTITFKNEQGEHRTLHVASDTRIIGQKTISVSSLRVGDRIQVRGHVSLVTADSIVTGGSDAGLPPMGPPPFAGGPAAFGPPPGGPGFGPHGPRMPLADGMVVEEGKVVKLSPLTISFGGGRTLTVQMDSSTKLHKVSEMKLGEIKSGDRIAAMGRPDGDGSLRAFRVTINMPVPPRPAGMPGMLGQGPGGFGPGMGGPNGPAGGPGFGRSAAFGPGFGQQPPTPDGSAPGGPPPPDAPDDAP